MRQQDRAGLLILGEEPLSYLPPRPGRAQLAALLEALFGQHHRLAERDRALRWLRAGGVKVVDAPPAVAAELVNRYVEAKVQLLL